MGMRKPFSWRGLLCLALCISAVLGLLAWNGASAAVLVVSGLFVMVVVLGRSILWRGKRPAWAATLSGALIGVFSLWYLARNVPLGVPFVYAKYWGGAFRTRLVIEVAAIIPLCAALGFAVHIIFSACDCIVELARSFYSMWRERKPLREGLPRRQMWRLGMYVSVAAIAVVVYRPIEVALCWQLARDSLIRVGKRTPVFLPSEYLLRQLQFDPMNTWQGFFFDLCSACRDRLVARGVLVHRRFVFKHIKDRTEASRAVSRAVVARFRDNMFTTGTHNPGKPMVLEVYAPPEEIPEWERFVREHDVPSAGKAH